jgi:co-chaperonin GroES (HSP10)
MEKLSITPSNMNVVAEIHKLPTMEDGVYLGESPEGTKTAVEFYYAKAINLGPDVNSTNQCPELKLGDGIIFQQFAGYHVTTDDGFCKVVRGSEIVAITSNLDDMNVDTIKPTRDRILVKIIDQDVVQDGIYDPSSADPREADVQKGEVIACADGADNYKVGTIVAFDPYCGNMILNEGKTKLKTINSFDVLFSLEK